MNDAEGDGLAIAKFPHCSDRSELWSFCSESSGKRSAVEYTVVVVCSDRLDRTCISNRQFRRLV